MGLSSTYAVVVPGEHGDSLTECHRVAPGSPISQAPGAGVHQQFF
jgi:hypothetical protein